MPRRHLKFMGDIIVELKKKGRECKLIMIGKSNTDYGKNVKEYFENNNLNDNVYYVDRIEQRYLSRVYQACTAFLFPSTYEIFGMVLMEAMYFGLPVISCENGGSTMLIKNGINMPLFFALSGYILYKFGKHIPFQKFLLKRTKSILWPFILFRFLLFIYWIVIESHFRDFDMGPIWFLIILYLAELVAYPIFYNKKSNSFWIVSVCCLVAVLWFALNLVLPANFLSSWFLRFLNGLMWYILGYVCGIVEQDIRMI